MALASGRADALSGCFITPHDDLDATIGMAAEIKERKLHSLEVHRR
jgi:hypothetical protein